MDSTALLHLLHTYAATLPSPPQLCALHVHHGLSTQAEHWSEHCASWCATRNISFVSERAKVQQTPRHSTEACARSARYAAFRKHLDSGDCLFLAHHVDDQMETLLLRLNRGSGVRGLGAMAIERAIGPARLVRPLLHWERKQILAYAQAEQLTWIEDDSNTNLDLDRNFLRHKVFPLLGDRWSGYRRAWQRAIALLRESNALNEALAQLDWEAGGRDLHQDHLKKIGVARCANLLRYRLHALDIRAPNEARLREFIRQLYEASARATPLLEWPAGALRLSSGKVEILSRS